MNFKRPAFEIWTSYRGRLVPLLLLILASFVFALVLLVPPSKSVTSIFYNFNIQISLVLVIFLGLVFSKRGMGWELISLILVMALFGLPLIYKWQTAKFDGVMFGGLLPWSDASVYYTSAHRLLAGSYLSEVATWRPLFTGFLTVLLLGTGNNLQISLAILAALNGAAAFLTAREIQKAHNAFVASTFVTICYWYYCAIAGTAMTENLGLCFGTLSLAFFMQGAENKNLRRVAYGLFLLTIALSIRAGAFFILPALLLWLAILFKRDVGWKGLLLAGMTVLIAMSSNMIFKKAIGNPKAVLFSNYSYTLYGLASGYAGWKQVLVEYPDASREEIFNLAISKIKNNPRLFAVGIGRSFQDYFSMANGGYSFLRLIYDKKNFGSHLLWILTWMGVAAALFHRKRPLSWLILFAFLGILLSTTLVPPIDADSMRVFAATMPFTAYLAAMGILLPQILLEKIGLSADTSMPEWKTDHLLLPFSVGLLVISLLFPLLVKGRGEPLQTDNSLACLPEEDEILFLMGSRSSLRLVDDRTVRESYPPALPVKVFRTGTESGPGFYPFLTQELVGLEPGYAISIGAYRKVTAQDQGDIQLGYLITDGPLLETGPHQLCVTPAKDENLRNTFFYYSTAHRAENQDVSWIQQDSRFAGVIRLLYGLGLLVLLLGVFEFWSLTLSGKIFVFGSLILIIVGLFINLHSAAIYPLAWERRSLQTVDAIPVAGHAYQLDLGIDWMDRRALSGSPAVIYEDGIPLKHPNNSPFNIKQRGKGRFSVENGHLFFSASDNSDPRKNGRSYEIYWPTPIPIFYQYVFFVSFLIGVFFLVRYFPIHVRDRD